ncbi:MAG TPA: hemolysin III family protein [Bacteroidales bacterium]|nr:hemolysin III family protein [Bacteroidales bacterium]
MEQRPRFPYLHEVFNSITHGIGVLLSIAALVLLLVFAVIRNGDAWQIVSFSIYGASLIILYLSSTLFHAIQRPRTKRFFNLLDHASIFILIAGTYTPFCLVPLRGPWGWTLFGIIWGLAIAGVLFKIFYYSERWRIVGTIIYIAMGWLILIALRPLLQNVPEGALLLLLGGGLSYSFGVIFYLWRRFRFNHVVWHLFVLGGSICHFFAIFLHLMPKAQ